jgi:hypothetical protein
MQHQDPPELRHTVDQIAATFDRQLSAEAVTAVIEHRPLTAALVRALNPERSHHDLAADLDRIGYPAA